MNLSPNNKQRGFTLLELSISLVIIGLLVGGIMLGKQLIQQARLRGTIAEIDQYLKAAKLFQDQYMALPGDMKNATSIWGAADADPETCKYTIGTGTQTCNGDGDGRITWQVAHSDTWYEQFRFWQHLSNAHLIQGQFSGVTLGGAAGTQVYSLGVNAPASSVKGGVYFAQNLSLAEAQALSAQFFVVNYGNYLRLATESSGAVLTPAEAYQIDEKMDDGLPFSGKVVPFRNTVTADCLSPDDTATGRYNTGDSRTLCALHFIFGM